MRYYDILTFRLDGVVPFDDAKKVLNERVRQLIEEKGEHSDPRVVASSFDGGRIIYTIEYIAPRSKE